MLLQHPQSSSRSVAEHTQLMMVWLPLSLSLSLRARALSGRAILLGARAGSAMLNTAW